MLLPMADLGVSRQLSSFIAALQLGIKARFGGRVDHLRTTLSSDPDAESALRKQYLVLFDTVPGGTGYVKQLVTPDEPGGELPLFDVMRQALRKFEGCACWNSERDGCYRCLLGYRNSRDMDDTSARTAADLLRRILKEAEHVKQIASLSAVSISGLLDSLLELRFLEALRQVSRDGRSAVLKAAIVAGKSGYLFELGNRSWKVEPQHEIGLGMTFRPDFVLWPVWPKSQHTPIAVFLDGWEHHQDRIGKDMLQRMLLLESGRFDVYSFSWHDIDEVLLTSRSVKPTNLIHPQLSALRTWLQKKGFVAHADVAERPVFDLFVEDLLSETPPPWTAMGRNILASRMGPATAADRATWQKAVHRWLPAEAQPLASGIEPKLVAFDEQQQSPWFRSMRPMTAGGSRCWLGSTIPRERDSSQSTRRPGTVTCSCFSCSAG